MVEVLMKLTVDVMPPTNMRLGIRVPILGNTKLEIEDGIDCTVREFITSITNQSVQS